MSLLSLQSWLAIAQGKKLDDIDPVDLEECCQLVKHNSISGSKKSSVDVVSWRAHPPLTPAMNSYTSPRPDIHTMEQLTERSKHGSRSCELPQPQECQEVHRGEAR